MIKKWEKFNESSNESIKKEFKELIFQKFKEFESVFSDEEVSDYGIDVIGNDSENGVYKNTYDDLFCYDFKKNRSYQLDYWLECNLSRLFFNIRNGSSDLVIKCGIDIPGEKNKNIQPDILFFNTNSIQQLDDVITSYNRLKKLKFDNILLDFYGNDFKSAHIFALYKLPENLINRLRNVPLPYLGP